MRSCKPGEDNKTKFEEESKEGTQQEDTQDEIRNAEIKEISDWEENLLVRIHKKRDEFSVETGNYRAICLPSLVFKLIEGSLRKEVERILEEEQAAFRQESRTNNR